MIRSAGTIIVDLSNDAGDMGRVLCVRAYSNWDFPKGELEEGENLIQAAIRETEEETTLQHGADYILTGKLAPSTTYGSGSKQKTAYYYMGMRMSEKDPYLPVSEELGRPENDEYRWVPVEELSDLLPQRLQIIGAFIKGWIKEKQ
jgi:bis(5'-nucleosidyl)-tetraphosphatase